MVKELFSSIKQCTVSLLLKLLNQIMFSSIIKVAQFFSVGQMQMGKWVFEFEP